MRMRTSWRCAQSRCSLQNAEYMYGTSPRAMAPSQYSFHSSDIVMPRLVSSDAMCSWSIAALSLALRLSLG